MDPEQRKDMHEKSLLTKSVAPAINHKEQSLVYKRWANMLKEETSNLDSDGHDDLVESP